MCVGVDATGALMALLLSPVPQQGLQQAALALLLTKPLLPSVTAASTRAVSPFCFDKKLLGLLLLCVLHCVIPLLGLCSQGNCRKPPCVSCKLAGSRPFVATALYMVNNCL